MNFKIGDRIKICKPYMFLGRNHVGMTGKIVDVRSYRRNGGQPTHYLIKFEQYKIPHLYMISEIDISCCINRTSAEKELAMKEIEELSKAFTEAHPEGGDQMLREIKGDHLILDNNVMVGDDDLEEAAENYSYTNWQAGEYHDGAKDGLPFDAIGHTEKAFKAGAKWQLNKIMKDAFETTIKGYIGGDGVYFDVDIPQGIQVDEGDKVKVVFIKDK